MLDSNTTDFDILDSDIQDSDTRYTILSHTRKGWCPRTGGGQQLMIRIAVNEDIVLATCQDKYSK